MGAKLLFVVTEDWYFCSHRLALAVAAREAGYDVVVVTRVRDKGGLIRGHGLGLSAVEFARHGLNPFADIGLLYRLVRIYRKERPALVHHVAMKPILYGTFAAYLGGVPAVVNAFPGLGYIYVAGTWRAGAIRALLARTLRWLFRKVRSRVILQNPEDLGVLAGDGIVEAERAIVIRGSGVDLTQYAPTPERVGRPVVILAGRMLWAKGVREFVEAARDLAEAGCVARFALVGGADNGNPGSVPTSQLEAWRDSGAVEWWGRRDDMPEVFSESHIVCLPSSYGEGVPKVLIEAAACGRPIVATDIRGCREIVRHGENGFLVPPGNGLALREALRTFIEDGALRRRMGTAGRGIAEREFSVDRVVEETLAVYRELLAA